MSDTTPPRFNATPDDARAILKASDPSMVQLTADVLWRMRVEAVDEADKAALGIAWSAVQLLPRLAERVIASESPETSPPADP